MIDNLIDVILDSFPFSIWVRDSSSKFILCNKAFAEETNFKKSDIINKSLFDIYDKNEASKYYLSDINMIETRETEVLEYSIGSRVMNSYKTPLINSNGKIIGIFGYSNDITHRKLYEQKIISQKNLLQTLFDAIPDIIFYKDKDCKYLGYNKAFKKVIKKYNQTSFIGKTDLDVEPDKNLAKQFFKKDLHVMKSKKKDLNYIKLVNTHGKVNHIEIIKAPIIEDNGNVSGVVGICRDITYSKKLEEELRVLSYTDKLTGTFNRTCFDEKIKSLNSPSNFPLSIIMGDINGLKVVNDTFGHLKGDKIIISIFDLVKSVIRKTDYMFRWGGDELIILLPKTSSEEADAICKEIFKKCKNTPNDPIPLSIALGASTKTSKQETIDSILKDAEDKLFRQKLLLNKSIRSSIISSLQKSLSEKSVETEEHTRRLMEYTKQIGYKLGLSTWEIDEVVLLSQLHDIGKIGISEEILMKPAKLTKDEFEIMKLHCEKGFRIVQGSPELSHIARGILTHHEKWDGSGYPLNLKGEEIPLMSRIVSVVDSFDAMTNDRIYKKAIPQNLAIAELKRCSGSQFDPNIVSTFITILQCGNRMIE